MKVTVYQSGDSLGVLLPAAITKSLRLSAGDEVEILVHRAGSPLQTHAHPNASFDEVVDEVMVRRSAVMKALAK